MKKLDEESRAHVKNVIATGRHAAHLMCNPEQVRPLDEAAIEEEWKRAQEAEEAGVPVQPKPFEGYARQRLESLDPWKRIDATGAANEAIARNAETAPEDASTGIADILKGRASDSGPPMLSNASTTFQDVTQEALQGHKTVAAEAGAPAFLRRAFSLCERDDAAVDLQHLNTLQKVSQARCHAHCASALCH